MTAIFLTLIAGLFFLLGFGIVKFVKDKKKLSIIATSMAFVVMLGIVFLDLIPEIVELMRHCTLNVFLKVAIVTLPIIIGLGVLKLLDKLVPHHEHEHHEKEKNVKEHQEHTNHVGLITVFSLVLHNLLEGVFISVMSIDSFTVGLSMAIAVGLHNLPLGVEIASNMNLSKDKKLSTILLCLLIFSGVLGALLLTLMGSLHYLVIVLLMGLSLGMILYIVLFELLKEIFNYRNRKEIVYGFLMGIAIILCIIVID